MSDYNSSLPVRTENAGDVIIKVADATVPSQQLAISAAGEASVQITQPIPAGTNTIGSIKITDGTNTLSLTALGEAKVDITQPLPAGTNTIGDINAIISALPAGTNLLGKITLSQGGNDALVTGAGALVVDGSGSVQPISGTVTANQGTSPWVVDIADISGAAPSASNALPSRLTDGTAYYDARQIRALTSSDVVSANIRDASGTAFSVSNPLPVTDVGSIGDSINDFKDAASIAAGASDNHDYTVTAGKTLFLEGVESSGSGKSKMLLSIETGVASGVFTTRFVQMNSTATPDMSLKLTSPISVAAGVRVRVVMSNRDNQAQDLYSTIMGYEV